MQLGRVLELELVVLGRRDLGEQPIGPSTLDRGVWNGDESTAPPVQLTLQNTAVTDNSLVASRGLTVQGAGLFTTPTATITLTQALIAHNTTDQCFGCSGGAQRANDDGWRNVDRRSA